MFTKLKEKNQKLGNALDTLIKGVIGLILGFLSSFFLDSCKTFDFSAEKLDIQVQSEEQDLVDKTFDSMIESNNSSR